VGGRNNGDGDVDGDGDGGGILESREKSGREGARETEIIKVGN
jgi:hypothetical protein